jgi:1L-myo-inositol 1-phosphate cytidylyltransferase
MMSDHLFDPAIVARLISERPRAQGVILAVDRYIANPAIDLDDATKVRVNENGSIVSIGKTLQTYNAIDTGLFLATPALREAILASIEAGGSGSLSEGVQILAESGQAGTMDVGSCWWADIDDPRSLKAAEEQLHRASARIGDSD